MDEEWFVARVFEFAGEQGLLIQERRPGRSICFNETSKKWLHEGHIRQLYREGVLADGLERADLNRMIEGVAPGRPCTHVGMRKLVCLVKSGVSGGSTDEGGG